mmetsp:Transcript_129908/g.277386  ORF Transcript_129908/g.277386 Transcript_129908/m.277386 type:complete len:215 (+) Transcript_129908:868-1512(+)
MISMTFCFSRLRSSRRSKFCSWKSKASFSLSSAKLSKRWNSSRIWSASNSSRPCMTDCLDVDRGPRLPCRRMLPVFARVTVLVCSISSSSGMRSTPRDTTRVQPNESSSSPERCDAPAGTFCWERSISSLSQTAMNSASVARFSSMLDLCRSRSKCSRRLCTSSAEVSFPPHELEVGLGIGKGPLADLGEIVNGVSNTSESVTSCSSGICLGPP